VYNQRVARIQIILRKTRFQLQVRGQVTLEVFIDERGKVSVSSLQDNLTVIPEVHKSNVLFAIRQKLTSIPLPPPKDKDGNPVRFNWRVTYKVGKYLNRVILTKQ
jgi:hypothetical protein